MNPVEMSDKENNNGNILEILDEEWSEKSQKIV